MTDAVGIDIWSDVDGAAEPACDGDDCLVLPADGAVAFPGGSSPGAPTSD